MVFHIDFDVVILKELSLDWSLDWLLLYQCTVHNQLVFCMVDIVHDEKKKKKKKLAIFFRIISAIIKLLEELQSLLTCY